MDPTCRHTCAWWLTLTRFSPFGQNHAEVEQEAVLTRLLSASTAKKGVEFLSEGQIVSRCHKRASFGHTYNTSMCLGVVKAMLFFSSLAYKLGET